MHLAQEHDRQRHPVKNGLRDGVCRQRAQSPEHKGSWEEKRDEDLAYGDQGTQETYRPKRKFSCVKKLATAQRL